MSSSLSSPYVEALQTFYNNVGKTYNDTTRSMHSGGPERIVEAAGSAVKEGSWVLDLATGTGKVGFVTASKVGNTGRVLGIDISDEFLGIASEAAKRLGVSSYVEFVQGDVGKLALPDAYTTRCFDAVTCGSAIGMFPSVQTVLDVIAKELLKPGGIFVADMYATHMPAKLFLDVAVPRGFQPPLDPKWLSDTETTFRNIFADSKLDLKSITLHVASQAKWDASTAEATEKLWTSIAFDQTWVSFGLDRLGAEVIEEIKQAWIKGLEDYKNSDGFVVAEMKQYIAVAVAQE